MPLLGNDITMFQEPEDKQCPIHLKTYIVTGRKELRYQIIIWWCHLWTAPCVITNFCPTSIFPTFCVAFILRGLVLQHAVHAFLSLYCNSVSIKADIKRGVFLYFCCFKSVQFNSSVLCSLQPQDKKVTPKRQLFRLNTNSVKAAVNTHKAAFELIFVWSHNNLWITLPFKMFGMGQKSLSRLAWSKFWPILANQ